MSFVGSRPLNCLPDPDDRILPDCFLNILQGESKTRADRGIPVLWPEWSGNLIGRDRPLKRIKKGDSAGFVGTEKGRTGQIALLIRLKPNLKCGLKYGNASRAAVRAPIPDLVWFSNESLVHYG